MKAQKLIAAGENESTVFKNCRDGIHTDVFETICAFLNGRGGTILLGVNENGSVLGLRERVIPDIIKGLERAMQNPEIFWPVFSLEPEEEIVEGKHILALTVPESPEVHALRGQIFMRRDSQNVRLERREELARLYVRKQDIYTERKIYPFLREHDLREELISRVRALALTEDEKHPWGCLENGALLAEMNLSGINYETGERGLRFLAALLLGKDSTIRNIFGNTDIYCEKQEEGRVVRLHLETNLLDEAEKITGFLENILGKEKAAAFAAVFLTEREYTCAHTAKIRVSERGVTAEFFGSMGRFGNPLLVKILRGLGLYREEHMTDMSLKRKDGLCLLCVSKGRSEKQSGRRSDATVSVQKKQSIQRKQSFENGEGENVPSEENIPEGTTAASGFAKEVIQETLPFVTDAYAQRTEPFTPQERQTEILKMMAENDRVSIGTMVRSLQVTKRTILRDIDKLKKQHLVIREGSEKNGRWLLVPPQEALSQRVLAQEESAQEMPPQGNDEQENHD